MIISVSLPKLALLFIMHACFFPLVLHRLLILVFTQNSGDDKTSVNFLGLVSVSSMKAGKLADSVFFGISAGLLDNIVANGKNLHSNNCANLAKFTIK